MIYNNSKVFQMFLNCYGQVDWCFGDETVERLSLEGEVGVDPDPAVANHNLLLDNIHKVEGEL